MILRGWLFGNPRAVRLRTATVATTEVVIMRPALRGDAPRSRPSAADMSKAI